MLKLFSPPTEGDIKARGRTLKQNIQRILKILYALQKIDPEFPIQYAICISEVALNKGLSMTDLSEKTGIALSTVSRMANILSNKNTNKKTYNLLHLRTPPEERRKKQIYLTPHGHAFIKTLTKETQISA